MAVEGRRVIFPIILIVVGVLFLLSNLGFLQWGQLRTFIGTWWPVILIAIGIEHLMRRR